MNAVMMVAGLVMLLVGGEGLVRGAVAFATRMRLPMAVVGAVVLGFGTSMPEMLTSLSAALAGAPGIAIGNVLGSNIANIALILGVAAVIAAIPADTAAFEDRLWLIVASAWYRGDPRRVEHRPDRRRDLAGRSGDLSVARASP